MQQRARLIGDGLVVVSGRALASLSGLVLTMVLSRLLAPPDVGKYLTILSIVIPASILAQLGMDITAVRNVALSIASGETARARKVVRETISYGGLGIVAASMILFSAGRLLALDLRATVIVIVWMDCGPRKVFSLRSCAVFMTSGQRQFSVK